MIVSQPTLHFPASAQATEQSQVAASIEGSSYVFRDEAILGTRMQIHLVARNYSDAQAAALNARNEIDRLSAIFNSRDPGSDIAILNRSRVYRASPELFEVVAAAERWRADSANAFSGRLGHPIALWQDAQAQTPSRAELARLAGAADTAYIHLDSATHTITRPNEVVFALDALAKGWIVDRAFEVARASPGVSGALVNIGGDIRCGGQSPESKGWCVGIPDARFPVDNAPLAANLYLSNQAIATSGRGPRDRALDGVFYSPTLSPRDGWPTQHSVSVSAVASTAAVADAAATILLTLPRPQALEWAERHGVTARIVTSDDEVLTNDLHSDESAARVRFIPVKSPTKTKSNTEDRDIARWPQGWVSLVVFTAPPRQLVRDQHFRSPYAAMWISDMDNKPIRTLLLVGTHLDWQEDNFIWWSLNRANTSQLAAARSMSTSGSGIYKMLWDGTDDQFKEVSSGSYVLHVETSQERGKHTHRSLTLDFSSGKPFTSHIPVSEEAGGLTIDFYHP
jgi:thiamine biosynthesis lipoprotein